MDLIVSTVYSGKEFNLLYQKPLYKVTNQKEIHYKLEYKDGLNCDTMVFNPTALCSSGGLYITGFELLPKYFKYGVYLRDITIPDDALVYVEPYSFKCNKIILGSRRLIRELEWWNDINFCKRALNLDGELIRYVPKTLKSVDIYKEALTNTGFVLEFIDKEDITEELCEIAVKQASSALQYVPIELQTPKIISIALEKDDYAKKYIKVNTFLSISQ